MEPKYSFIIPIYNEAEAIPELYQRISAVMDRMDGEAELILINDGSNDGSIKLIRNLREKDERVRYLSLARNFGHQIAVTAGLNFARGHAVVIMDADLQDPPELVLEMEKLWRQGSQVIYAQRIGRRSDNWFKRWCAYVFYRILNKLADVDIPTDTGDFCLMDREIVALLNAMPERHRYIRGLRSWVGFRQTAIHFERDPRIAGQSKYPFRKSLALAVNGLLSFSKVPLRISTYIGLLSAIGALIMALLVLFWRLYQPHSPVIGFAAIAVAIFFLGAVQLISIGIMGEYIGRIYEEIKGRPLYTLAEINGFEDLPEMGTRARPLGLNRGRVSVAKEEPE